MLYALAHVQSVVIPKVSSTNPSNICTTDACTTEANRILNSLDANIDPCANFHAFACGKYERNTVLPEGKPKESTFSQGQDEIDRQLQSVLLEKIQPNEPKAFKLAKEFTRMCMDETALNEQGIKWRPIVLVYSTTKFHI